jgi:hypothetical protein
VAYRNSASYNSAYRAVYAPLKKALVRDRRKAAPKHDAAFLVRAISKGIKLSWDLLILKILASRPNGEASTAEVTRDLTLLSSAGLKRREVEGGIFVTGYVEFPTKGRWRITDRGRAYLDNLAEGPPGAV